MHIVGAEAQAQRAYECVAFSWHALGPLVAEEGRPVGSFRLPTQNFRRRAERGGRPVGMYRVRITPKSKKRGAVGRVRTHSSTINFAPPDISAEN